MEKVLDISLERTVTSAKELDEVLQSLNQQRGNYLTFSSVPSLRRAVRLYYEFVKSMQLVNCLSVDALRHCSRSGLRFASAA